MVQLRQRILTMDDELLRVIIGVGTKSSDKLLLKLQGTAFLQVDLRNRSKVKTGKSHILNTIYSRKIKVFIRKGYTGVGYAEANQILGASLPTQRIELELALLTNRLVRANRYSAESKSLIFSRSSHGYDVSGALYSASNTRMFGSHKEKETSSTGLILSMGGSLVCAVVWLLRT